jgi:GntR family transcriptional repressor for pyruvate dehydrogenase complex
MFEPINNKKNYQYIVEQIQQMIINKELKFGDKLPPEREMSENFGVSRTSVREALKALEVIGILESRQGEGNFIVNKLDGYTTNGLSIMFALNNGTLLELLQLRCSLEVESIRNIINRDDTTAIDQLRGIIGQYNQCVDSDERIALDKLFHMTIISLSNNILYKYLYNMLSVLITPYIEDIVKISLEVYPESALIQEHNEIFKAIEEKDISKVYNAIAAHVLLAETPPFYEGTDFDYFEALSKFRRWSL